MGRKEVLNPTTIHKPSGYSHAVRKGNTLYIAGQVAWDQQGQVVGPGDIRAQTEQIFHNIKTILEEAGSGLDRLVKTTNFIINTDDYPAFNEVRSKYLPKPAPASTTVVIKELVLPELLVEVDAVAAV